VGLTSPPRVGVFPDFQLDRSLAKPAVGGDRMWLALARDEGPREWRIGDNGENSHAETFAPRGAGRAGNCCNERACLLLSYAATTASAGGTAGSATAATASAARGSSLRWSDRRSERLRRRRQWRRLPLGGRFSNCRRWVSAIIALKSPRPHEAGERVRVRGMTMPLMPIAVLPCEAGEGDRAKRAVEGAITHEVVRVEPEKFPRPHEVAAFARASACQVRLACRGVAEGEVGGRGLG